MQWGLVQKIGRSPILDLIALPFSKFYLEVDKESPGGIGVWYGWQIVKSYAENNETDLKTLLQTDNEEIFKRSKYKPKK